MIQSPSSPEKINLRALEPEDLEILYQIENDPVLWDAGITNVPYSRFLLHEYISQSRGDIYADGQVRLIIETADKQVVGIADLTNFSASHRRAEIGIVIMRPYRHQGFASLVLQQIADYATRILHLHQLYAVISSDNTISLHLFQSAGYEKTAEMSDWLFDGHFYRSAFLFQKIL